MEELSFKLETFEGPMDLLLQLISKHKLDIRDIEISVLVEQYMAKVKWENRTKKQTNSILKAHTE